MCTGPRADASRVPSIPAINPKVDPQLDEIVRKALARHPEHRTASAPDFADELAHHLFERELKVTSRNVANAVQAVRAAKKPSSSAQSLIDALIADEVAKMTSIVDEKSESDIPKPAELVDTADWASELIDK